MKTKRHAKILEIIHQKSVETQEDLLLLLREDGYNVTQATVSRDIKELRLIKALGPDGRYRYSTVRITFASNCKRSLNVSMPSYEPSLHLLLYPASYPVVSPNFTSSFQDLPAFAKEITVSSFNGSDTLSYNFSAGELFLGFRCCAGLFVSRSTGQYAVVQTNITECDITVEAFGPTVLVSSLKLFYGTLVLILLPAVITIAVHCIAVAGQRSTADKSEAAFKRVRCECCFFWLAWVVTFVFYIIAVLVPLY